MDGKGSALLQRTQRFQDIGLFVAGNVVIHIVAAYRVKVFIREIQMRGISLTEFRVPDAFRPGVVLTQGFAE